MPTIEWKNSYRALQLVPYTSGGGPNHIIHNMSSIVSSALIWPAPTPKWEGTWVKDKKLSKSWDSSNLDAPYTASGEYAQRWVIRDVDKHLEIQSFNGLERANEDVSSLTQHTSGRHHRPDQKKKMCRMIKECPLHGLNSYDNSTGI